MTRAARLAFLFDLLLVVVFALCLWAPWDRAADVSNASLNMLWLTLPMALAHRGGHLDTVTVTVTLCAIAAVAVGAALAIVARIRGSAVLRAVGIFLFAASVAILMPEWTAVGFLGAVLLVVALRARFVPVPAMPTVAAVLTELWPLGYAAGFAAFAWRYNPQSLLKVLVIAFGLSLVARALVPSEYGRRGGELAS
jgi:hypothetical protein